jgi:hypothetical protein
VISKAKAEHLAVVFGLDDAQRDEFLAAWDATPLSAYGEAQRANWDRQNARRSKAKAYDRYRLLLVDLLELMTATNVTCACDPGDFEYPPYECELCQGLRELGLKMRWTDPMQVGEALTKICPIGRKEKGERAIVAPARGA